MQSIITLFKTTLVGIGQIFLQQNGLSGLLITLAMFFSHWTLGVGVFLGALIGTLLAQSLRFDLQKIQQGLYGFNGSLAFMCVMFTFGLSDSFNPVVWLLAVGSAIISTLIMHLFIKYNKIAFTFPFVLTSWLTCWAVGEWQLFGLTPDMPSLSELDKMQVLSESFHAWAEVNFSENVLTGIVLFLAIAISSPVAAMWGTAAAAISPMIANYLLNIDPIELTNGIYGFSPILVACAFAGSKLRHFFYVIIGVLLAIFIQYTFAKGGIPPYTIGFIGASWLLLAFKSNIDQAEYQANKLVRLFNP